MKTTFFNLDDAKRQRVMDAALEEFGFYGYERGSTDRIIRRSGISKGGLYEYIESKQDLFVYLVQEAYNSLYAYIQKQLDESGKPSRGGDLLDLVNHASRAALDFYLEHPPVVRLIASLASLTDPDVRQKVDSLFTEQFLELFGGADFSGLRFEPEKVLDLLKWLLIKTRNDYVAAAERFEDRAQIEEAYLADWNFILAVLRDGVYF